MKINCSVLTALSFLTILQINHARADSEIIASAQATQASLGDGYRSTSQQFAGNCINNDTTNTVWAGQQNASIQFERSMTASEARDSLGFGLEARAQFGLTSASAAAQFARETSSDEYSESSTYSAKIAFKNIKLKSPILTTLAESRKSNATAFKKLCGEEYVEQIQLGAALFVNLKVHFASKEDKESFSSQVNMKGATYQVSGEIQKASKNFSKTSYITVKLLQLGGDVSRLASIFSAATTDNKTAKNPTVNSPLAIVNCSMDDLASCTAVINAVVKYGSDDLPKAFSNQIDPSSNPVGSMNGPAVIRYITKTWDSAGVDLGNPVSDAAAANAKKELSILFENQLNVSNRLRALGIARIRLSKSQRDKTQSIEQIVDANIHAISRSATLCYDNESKCVPELQNLRGKEGTPGIIKEIDESALAIYPETFAQYCDVVEMPKYSRRMGNLVNALVEIARNDISDQSWQNAVDKCFLADKMIKDVTSISVPFAEVSDLGVLSTLPQIKKLYLNGNPIESIDALKSLSQLETLSLSGTMVRDFSPLAQLPHLNELMLNNTPTLGKEIKIRALFPKVTISFTSDEVCRSERMRMFEERLINQSEFNKYETSNMAPWYAHMGDRNSGINLWKPCVQSAYNL